MMTCGAIKPQWVILQHNVVHLELYCPINKIALETIDKQSKYFYQKGGIIKTFRNKIVDKNKTFFNPQLF